MIFLIINASKYNIPIMKISHKSICSMLLQKKIVLELCLYHNLVSNYTVLIN